MTDLATQMDAIATIAVKNGVTLKQACGLFRKRCVVVALNLSKGNITLASRTLGVHRNTLHHDLSAQRSPHDKRLRRQLTAAQQQLNEIRAEIASQAKRKSK